MQYVVLSCFWERFGVTYCVAMKLNEGLVLLSDTRTNAGLDNVSRFNKMFSWENPGERIVTIMTSGNLSITQGVNNMINRALAQAQEGEDVETILNCSTMYRVAQIFGDCLRSLRQHYTQGRSQNDTLYDAAVLLAGQRRGGRQRIYMIYAEGNFIEATDDTPYFQIGEHKYGKPILDRVITCQTSLSDAIKVACLSMDSTLRSNLSVGMPLDLAVIKKNHYQYHVKRRIEADDIDFATLSMSWSEGLKKSFQDLPCLYNIE